MCLFFEHFENAHQKNKKEKKREKKTSKQIVGNKLVSIKRSIGSGFVSHLNIHMYGNLHPLQHILMHIT